MMSLLFQQQLLSMHLLRPSPLLMLTSLPLRHFGKGLRETRMKKIYCCMPEW